MAIRVAVTEPIVKSLPETPIGKVHKRIVVEQNGGNARVPARSIRAVFTDMLDKNMEVLADSEKPGAIDVFADLFVNSVKEEHGWHGQVIGIAESLEQNTDDKTMRNLATAIRYHAEQLWAARHVDDSKRSG
ncbi:hypothetical protein H0O01_01480 [Candidatus Micrarchaeota archaeon]|nr:hypothetical protein [Candidatus Micrarchaeota archaeon]